MLTPLTDYPGYPDVPPSPGGAAGLGMEGLVLLPRAGNARPRPTIVDIHGRPELGGQACLRSRLRPTVRRGGLCRLSPELSRQCRGGKEFGTLNIGDPAGAEFEDILLGIDHCVAPGLADPRSARRDRCKL